MADQGCSEYVFAGLGHFPEFAAPIDKYFQGLNRAKKDALIITDEGEYDEAFPGDWEDIEMRSRWTRVASAT